ncbi:MAG: CHAP domain-containing protein [Treponema sp.]|nr:CHAP domain-containing protein [Treponema sp.]
MKFEFLKEISKTWLNKTVPFPVPDPHKLQGHCVQFIRWVLQKYLKLPQWKANPGAADFWFAYDKDPAINKYWERIPDTPDFIPKEGDIVFWNKNMGGGFGHVAIIYGDDQTVRYFYSIESNWKPLVVTVVRHNYNNVLGFFRPRNRVTKPVCKQFEDMSA